MSSPLTQEGLYLVRILNYIQDVATNRNVTLNQFLSDLGDFSTPLQFQGNPLLAVEPPDFEAPVIPNKIDDNTFDMLKELQQKIVTPMLEGVQDLMDRFFPCNESLFQTEITALEKMLNSGHNDDLNLQMDIEMRQAKDARFMEMLEAQAAVARTVSAAGFTIMPGTGVQGILDLQTAALSTAADSKSEAAVARIQAELDLIKRAIEQVIQYRKQILAALAGYMRGIIGAAAPGLGIASASTQQQTRLINAVSSYVGSLQNAERISLQSRTQVQSLQQQMNLEDNQRLVNDTERKLRQVIEAAGILSSQAAAALNTMSAQGAVQHQVR